MYKIRDSGAVRNLKKEEKKTRQTPNNIELCEFLQNSQRRGEYKKKALVITELRLGVYIDELYGVQLTKRENVLFKCVFRLAFGVM